MNTLIFLILTVFGATLSILEIKWLKQRINSQSIVLQKTIEWVKAIMLISVILVGASFTIMSHFEEQNKRREEALYSGVSLQPDTIALPAHSNAVIPITITNNFPFPIYSVGVEIKRLKGNILLGKETYFYPSPPVQPDFDDYQSQDIYQINARSTMVCLYQIMGKNSDSPIQISLLLADSAYKSPGTTSFEITDINDPPKHIPIPKGFLPSGKISIKPKPN